jgi:hypothetical protein
MGAKDYASIIKPSGSYLVSESNYVLALAKMTLFA